jgi:hypothetical protein
VWEVETGLWSRLAQAKNVTPYLKNNSKAKRAGVVIQMVEHLPGKCEALSSTPSTIKNK